MCKLSVSAQSGVAKAEDGFRDGGLKYLRESLGRNPRSP